MGPLLVESTVIFIITKPVLYSTSLWEVIAGKLFVTAMEGIFLILPREVMNNFVVFPTCILFM